MLMVNQLAGFGMLAAAATPPAWQTTFQATLNNTAFVGVNTYTMRQAFAASLWTVPTTGSKIRTRFRSATTLGWVLVEAFIGEVAGAGDPYDFAATPTRITFSTGANGFSLSAASQIVSDDITFALDPSKKYMIAMEMNDAGGTVGPEGLGTLAGAVCYEKVGNEAQVVDASGYIVASSGSALCGINRIETFA